MKKGLMILCLVFFLSLSFVSAGFFGDIFGKITGEVVDDGNRVPLYRFWNGTTHDNFYTTNEDEKARVIVAGTYSYEGIEGYIYSTTQAGTIPLYRLWNNVIQNHFYTTDVNEKVFAIGNLGYSYEGVEGYIYSTTQAGTIPLYRLWNGATHDHFYTTNEDEKVFAMENLKYTYEGIIGYVFANVEDVLVETTCTDSDEGLNIYKKGTTSGLDWAEDNVVTKIDYCILDGEKAGRLNEYECFKFDDGLVRVRSITFGPEDGCSSCQDGACVSNPLATDKQCSEFGYNTQNEVINCCDALCNNYDLSVCSNVTQECSDSDGGKDYYSFGQTSVSSSFEPGPSCDGSMDLSGGGGGSLAKDTCVNNNTLNERICNANGTGSFVEYTCLDGCQDGACIEEQNEVCQDLISKIKNPKDFVDEGIGYTLSRNNFYEGNLWINGNEEKMKEYSTSWNVHYQDDKYYYLHQNVIVFDNKEINLKDWLNERTNYMVCQSVIFWSADNKENKVYVCNWDVLNNQQSLDNYQSKSRETLWVNNNVFVTINTNVGEWLSDEEVAKIASKRASEFLDDLKNNEGKYLDWSDFDIEWPLSRQIEKGLFECASESFSEIPSDAECNACWTCKTEPVVCPPHGEQTTTCVDTCCEDEVKETVKSCSPGICSGCYVPRWFGNQFADNKCIPYGFRFASEDVDTNEKLYESLENSSSEEYSLEITSDGEAILKLWDYSTGFDATYFLREGSEIKIPKEFEGLEMILFIDEIVYNENGENYMVFSLVEKFNAYCDIDGRVKRQKLVDYKGNWATCQNNYECYSNICSSGECIELQKMLNEVSGFKNLGVRVLCRLAHFFNEEEYNTCMVNFVGE